MRYVTADEMRRIDYDAIENRGVKALDLMEKAGRALAEEVTKITKLGEVAVFCGYGNNGGDGLVAARYLSRAKYSVIVYMAGNDKMFSRETETNYYTLLNMGVPIVHITEKNNLSELFIGISRPSVVIDAIFGIGFHGGLDLFYFNLIENINNMNAPIISADIPSGLDADSGHALPLAITAARTVTFGYPKKGFQNPSARQFTGEIVVADIGLSG